MRGEKGVITWAVILMLLLTGGVLVWVGRGILLSEAARHREEFRTGIEKDLAEAAGKAVAAAEGVLVSAREGSRRSVQTEADAVAAEVKARIEAAAEVRVAERKLSLTLESGPGEPPAAEPGKLADDLLREIDGFATRRLAPGFRLEIFESGRTGPILTRGTLPDSASRSATQSTSGTAPCVGSAQVRFDLGKAKLDWTVKVSGVESSLAGGEAQLQALGKLREVLCAKPGGAQVGFRVEDASGKVLEKRGEDIGAAPKPGLKAVWGEHALTGAVASHPLGWVLVWSARPPADPARPSPLDVAPFRMFLIGAGIGYAALLAAAFATLGLRRRRAASEGEEYREARDEVRREVAALEGASGRPGKPGGGGAAETNLERLQRRLEADEPFTGDVAAAANSELLKILLGKIRSGKVD